MAERWEVSDDGLTWTFFLRDALWSDGRPCNAHDFEFSLKRILDPRRWRNTRRSCSRSKTRAVNAGRLTPDRLGVAAIDDRTLEIDLEHPAGYLPQLLKHYTAMPVRSTWCSVLAIIGSTRRTLSSTARICCANGGRTI